MHEFVYEVLMERIPRAAQNCKCRKDGTHYLAVNIDGQVEMSSLNTMSAEIFKMCDGTNKVKDIINYLHDLFPKVEYDRIKDDVIRCIKDLEVRQLITVYGWA